MQDDPASKLLTPFCGYDEHCCRCADQQTLGRPAVQHIQIVGDAQQQHCQQNAVHHSIIASVRQQH
jgi:hypothetical protein